MEKHDDNSLSKIFMELSNHCYVNGSGEDITVILPENIFMQHINLFTPESKYTLPGLKKFGSSGWIKLHVHSNIVNILNERQYGIKKNRKAK